MVDLSISGGDLRAAAGALSNAIAAFGAAGHVATAADYGSGAVSAAVAAVAEGLRRASGVVEDRSSVSAHWASGTATQFAALELRVAAAMSA